MREDRTAAIVYQVADTEGKLKIGSELQGSAVAFC